MSGEEDIQRSDHLQTITIPHVTLQALFLLEVHERFNLMDDVSFSTSNYIIMCQA